MSGLSMKGHFTVYYLRDLTEWKLQELTFLICLSDVSSDTSSQEGDPIPLFFIKDKTQSRCWLSQRLVRITPPYRASPHTASLSCSDIHLSSVD